MDEISQIFQCSFTLFISKSHEHRFNAVLTAFSKIGNAHLHKSKFQTKTRFYLYFWLVRGLALQQEKIAFRNLKKFSNAHLHISFFKTKQMRFSSSINDENKASFRRKNWRKYTQKNFKNIAEGYRENRALTELPIMCFGTVPETLKWAFCFFIFCH